MRRVAGITGADIDVATIVALYNVAAPAKLHVNGESFTLTGVPALMVTDTAPFRYPHYHTASDTPDKVDYERLARVVAGLVHVIESLGNTSAK